MRIYIQSIFGLHYSYLFVYPVLHLYKRHLRNLLRCLSRKDMELRFRVYNILNLKRFQRIRSPCLPIGKQLRDKSHPGIGG